MKNPLNNSTDLSLVPLGAGDLIDRDQEAETPLVAAVRDEGEVGAAR